MNLDDNNAPHATNDAPLGELIAAEPTIEPVKPMQRPNRAERVAAGLWNWVLPVMFLMSLTVLAIYAAPYLVYHWKIMDAHADAEAARMKRLAELEVEAEFADKRLDILDKRVQLTSLGFRALAQKVVPIVVNVVNYREKTDKDLPDIKAKRVTVVFDPDTDREYVQYSVGSGIIYKPGVILTNHHVIRDADRLRVSFPSGRSVGIEPSAAVSDQKTDLAVIRLPENLQAAVKEESQKTAEFADSDKDVHVADWVLAMGSPLGLRHTVTHGIISAKGRLLATRENENDLIELLQTDAAINPGNSGGPLFDQLGRVVGINAMIASDTGRGQGIGFAIPSNTVKKVAELLLTKGEVPRGFLGIGMDELPGADAKALKIEDGAVVVNSLVRGGGADKAGIKLGDIIVRVNKEALERNRPYRHIRQIVADLEPGTEIIVEVIRDDEHLHLPLTLGKRPANFR